MTAGHDNDTGSTRDRHHFLDAHRFLGLPGPRRFLGFSGFSGPRCFLGFLGLRDLIDRPGVHAR
ncbi:hypothetical protein ACIBCM_14805 [Streptomyces sp. NPDC051018]|uniref:hypothetical protein n=1 Tax=Streptomyces sp. NPDC051018 TaxID=3365639 RepID=UPI0037983A89